jgi:protein O-GlcNAc transferase
MLLLTDPGSHVQRTINVLCHEGIDLTRVEFIPRQSRQDYLKLYHRIDLGLDSLPYNGHTTTLDSLWMGVPVISLAGKIAVGRGGLTILSNLGLPELVASSEEEYVRIAVELAHDVPRLSGLHSTLRQRMEQSPLMDAPRFARNIEWAYRQMWQKWCAASAEHS